MASRCAISSTNAWDSRCRICEFLCRGHAAMRDNRAGKQRIIAKRQGFNARKAHLSARMKARHLLCPGLSSDKHFSVWSNMSVLEPVIIVPQPVRAPCPICGKPSYSRGGIHPQCAMRQADEPRLVRLRAAKKAETKVAKPSAWNKKCPKCNVSLHGRRGVCKCGHKFSSP